MSIAPPELHGHEPEDIAFPEWFDQEINSEKWELPKGTSVASGLSGGSQTNVFSDPHQATLPSYFMPSAWKKTAELYQNTTLLIYNEGWNYSNLIEGNEHLVENEFMRQFISSIGILEHLGFTNRWKSEGLGGGFVPNTDDVPWRGWHHVYSLCRAGRGGRHTPRVNRFGRYIVRLFWMGCWRRCVVDDLVPLDKNNKNLLPVIFTPSSIEEGVLVPPKVELWPLLLSKAILKVASLTSSNKEDLVDCDIISLLTGWMVQKINILDTELQDVWDICTAYSDHYKWPKEEEEEGTDVSSKLTTKSTKSAKTAKKEPSKASLIIPMACCLVGKFNDLRSVPSSILPDFAQLWSHSFFIEQSRNIPLLQPAPKEGLARWKRFRWLAWATAKGIYVEESVDVIKCLKVISIFKKFTKTRQIHSEFSSDISQLSAMIDEIRHDPDTSDKDHDSELKCKETKSRIDPVKSALKQNEIEAPESPSVWCDFNAIRPYIAQLYIYSKPSFFTSNIKISNFQDKSAESTRPSATYQLQKRYFWPDKPKLCRNQPFHIFVDSLDYNFMMVNLSQAGNKNLVLCSNRWRERSLIDSTVGFNQKSVTIEESECFMGKPQSHVIVEKYDWKSEKLGETVVAINTPGSKSMIYQIRPGRNSFRLWIKSNQSFLVQIVSDVFLIAGTQEEVFEYMRNESKLLLQTCYDIGGLFGKLMQAFGETGFQEKLISFHNSYKPDEPVSKCDYVLIRKEFCRELYNLIRERYGEHSKEFIRALRVLLIDFSYDYSRIINYDMNVLKMGNIQSSNESILEEKRRENAAVKMQSYFKMIYMKSMFKARLNTHKKYQQHQATLKAIYKDFFSVERRVNTVSTILRKLLLRNHNLEHIRDLYKIYHDLQSVINFDAFVNTVNTPQLNIPLHIQNSPTIATVIPIGRYVFYVNCIDSVVLKFSVNCDCDFYCLRIFNNDSGEETSRFTLNANVGEFISNLKGYTVLIYAITQQTTIESKVFVASLKYDNQNTILITEKQITLSTACDTYIPNVKQLIGKCQIFIKSEATFRCTASSEDVKLKLRCLDESGNICDEITGKGCVILPIVDLSPKKLEMSDLKMPTLSSLATLRSRSLTSRDSFQKRKRRGSDAGSVLSVRRSRKRSAYKSDTLDQPVYYVVEVYMLENSWPLTLEEWSRVNEVGKRELIGSELLKEGSMSSGLRERSRSKKLSISENINLEKPFWCVQAIHNTLEDVKLVVDRRRQEEIKNIKRGWFYNNIDRYNKAIEKRKSYLENQDDSSSTFSSVNDILREINYEENVINNDDENKEIISKTEVENQSYRTLKKPKSASEILPPLDYTTYALLDKDAMENVSEVNLRHVDTLLNLAKLKTGEDVAKDETMLENSKQEFSNLQQRHYEIFLDMRMRGLEQNLLIENWYRECRGESEEMMKKAYHMKDEYLQAEFLRDIKKKK